MTQIFVKYILHLCIFRWKLEIALAIPASNDENRTPTPVYLDPGMHSGLEVKGLNVSCGNAPVLLQSIPQ